MTDYIFDSKLFATDAVLVPMFEDGLFEPFIKNLDKQYDNILSKIIAAKDFEGKNGQISLLYAGREPKLIRFFLIGLGLKKELSARRLKTALGAGLIAAQSKKTDRISVILPSDAIEKFGPYETAKASVVALSVASYAYDDYKKKNVRVHQIKQIILTAALDSRGKTAVEKGVRDGEAIARSVNYTRHLGNTPPTIMTPAYLAREAERLGKKYPKLKVKILSRVDIKKLGMGCLLGVARGSALPPKFIIVEYKGGGKKDKPFVLIGKGITFDSGGISIKPSRYLNDMKFDMLGGATVLGVIKAAAELKLKKNIICLVPSCENMPDGSAYRPDDILTAMDGTTVHISNTDAEGRLVLADALCYAVKYGPKEVIDFATLTGHCRVALGMERSGLFSNDESMAKKLIESADRVGEQLWRLPLGEEFTEGIKSEVADIDNSGTVGEAGSGGASLGAAFLEHFAKYPWAHIDMSCCYYTPKGKPWIRVGAIGFGVETMIEYLL